RAGFSAIYNRYGTFTNAANITMGAIDSVGSYGIYNRADFANNSGGDIKIDRSGFAGININAGTFDNSAKITVGSIDSVGSYGIYNRNIVNNNTGGEIIINRSSYSGIYNLSGTFNNYASITIGATHGVGSHGILNEYAFNNLAGNIKIDRATDSYILNDNGGYFENDASITVGTIPTAGITGVVNNFVFSNNACASLIVKSRGIVNNTSVAMGNSGFIQVDGNLNNSTIFTNHGVLKYNTLTGTISSPTDSSVIVNNTPTPIFTYGGTYNGTINGIYTNAAATTPAGTFTAPNTFVPGSLPVGLQTLYAKITPKGGGCAFIVPFTYMVGPEINLKSNNIDIISADSILNYPDFRAFERSFQLLSQVSGRAGR
ncbi:MAG: hypothetical protein EOP47_30545, partial [Sphingobacteriaceae bacterium]